MGGWIPYIILLGAAVAVALICMASSRPSIKLRRRKAARLAHDLLMELLASDNPNTLIVAGEVNDRPSTIRYQSEKRAPEHIASGSPPEETEVEELIMSVECDFSIDFSVAKVDSENATNNENYVPVAMLTANGLKLESKQKEKATSIFEQPETVQSLIDLCKDTGAIRLDVCGNKVNALIVESADQPISSAQISSILERLDKFARLLEFLAEEQQHSEN